MAQRTLFLTDEDVKAVFDWRAAVSALRESYSSQPAPSNFPPRSIARGNGRWLRALTGVFPDGSLMGSKQIAANPKAGRVSYLISLFDQETTQLLALLDANSVTGFRTAATSALAADLLVPRTPLRVGVIGSGFEAKKHASAVASVRRIECISVFSPKATGRARFTEDLRELAIPIEAVESAKAAVDQADLVICAARSHDETPTFKGDWLRPGQTVLSIGSTLPEQREVDSETIRRADLVVADMVEEVAHETGDMLAAAKDGIAFLDKLTSLSALVRGDVSGRTSPDAIILYKSVGAALQDIAVANQCYRFALSRGLGTPLPVTVEPVRK